MNDDRDMQEGLATGDENCGRLWDVHLRAPDTGAPLVGGRATEHWEGVVYQFYARDPAAGEWWLAWWFDTVDEDDVYVYLRCPPALWMALRLGADYPYCVRTAPAGAVWRVALHVGFKTPPTVRCLDDRFEREAHVIAQPGCTMSLAHDT